MKVAVRWSGLLLLGLALTGCGFQIGAAARGRNASSLQGAVEVKTRFYGARSDGPYASIGSTIANPAGAPSWQMRNLSLGTGVRYRLLPWLRWEGGGELAFGEPIRIHYQSTGIYLGLDSALLVRLPWLGNHDNRLGAAPLGYSLDLVVTGQGGYWSRAAGSNDVSRPEVGVGIGIRVTAFSDLLSASDDSWRGRWDAQ